MGPSSQASQVPKLVPSDDVFKENVRYRVWMTAMFWAGIMCVVLKEWRQASWEDVAGAWSLFGVISYGYWSWKPPQMNRFPRPLAWWRMAPAYALSGAMLVMTVLRYGGGADDPPMWIVRMMGQWGMEPDRDWLGMALAVVLLLTIITREICFTSEEAVKNSGK